MAEKLGKPGWAPVCPDDRLRTIMIGCGNCIECRKKEQLKWMTRLYEDIKHHKNGKFVVFTFSNDSIAKLCEEHIQRLDKETGELVTLKIGDLTGYDRDNQIATRALHNFRNRWRKHYKKSPRHWMITELGHQGTENIHLHGILWVEQHFDEILARWQYGYIYPRPEDYHKPNYVTDRSITYVTKYITKRDPKHKEYKGVILCSPGIGRDYINKHTETRHAFKHTQTIEAYKTSTGHEINMNSYWRNKLWDEEQREALWIQKLNKGKKYICGEELDSSDTDGIRETVQWYRRKNAELGYGQRPNDNRRYEEEQRRETLHNKRLANSQDTKGKGAGTITIKKSVDKRTKKRIIKPAKKP